MSKKEIDVVAIKNSLPDMRGQHLWVFLQTFGVPSSHGVCYGKYAGYEIYLWTGRGGEVEYIFDSNNICIDDDRCEFKKILKK